MAKKQILKVKLLNNRLKKLSDRKIELLTSLVGIEEKFNNFGKGITNAEEWLEGLTIRSLKDLHALEKDSNSLDRLGDWKKRSDLRKASEKTLNEIDQIEAQIRLMNLNLLSAKVEAALL